MVRTDLIGGASTQSRGRRPLPRDAVRGVTVSTRGVTEIVQFERADGTHYQKLLLSWIGGQAGLLWGMSGLFFPEEIWRSIDMNNTRFSGTRFSGSGAYGHSIEYRLADLLGEIYAPFVGDELGVRFFQSGGEACAAAVRCARAAMDQYCLLSYGYHGAASEFAHRPDFKGQLISNLLYNRPLAWGQPFNLDDVAAVMLEVPALDDEQEMAEYLHDTEDICHRHGVPFILDEVVTGFRLGLAGACERYDVHPDLVVLGKALSATGCVAAIVGRRDLVGLLDQGVFYSTTFGGAPGPCRVALETIKWLRQHRAEVYGADGYLQTIGRALKDSFNERGVPCVGQPERSVFAFPSDEEWLEFCVRMIEQGVMVHRPNFPTLAHTLDDVRMTMEAVESIKEMIA